MDDYRKLHNGIESSIEESLKLSIQKTHLVSKLSYSCIGYIFICNVGCNEALMINHLGK